MMKYLKTFENLFVGKNKDIKHWVDICYDVARNNPELVDIMRNKNHASATIIHYPTDSKNIRNVININADVFNNKYYSKLRVHKYIKEEFDYEDNNLSFTQANKIIRKLRKLVKKSHDVQYH
jgi:hypothetical protein